MATSVWAPGTVCKANFTLSGGAATDVNITGWTSTEKVDLAETTHSGSATYQEFIATVARVDGTISFNYDVGNQHHKTPPTVCAGSKGVLKLYVTATLYYSIPIIFEQVMGKVVTNGKVEMEATYRLSGDAGTYARPA